MMRGALFTVLSIVALSAALIVFPASSNAALQVSGEGCTALLAGQNIDAGTVCVSVDGPNLLVTYNTTGGWELVETHLWVGDDLLDLPRNKSGNPVPGRFTYKSGDITGATEYTFEIPLLTGIGDPLDALCGTTLFVAAHAALRKYVGGDDPYQTETGWGNGDRIVEKGNWATYFTVAFACPEEPVITCETAYGFGDTELWDLLKLNGKPVTHSWGWQITVPEGATNMTVDIWAAAGQNDLSKGTKVGTLRITYNGSLAVVDFLMDEGFTLDETHLYVGATDIQTDSPGQYGNQHDLTAAASDSYRVSISGDPIYVVAHAVVCGVFPESEPK